MKPAKVKPVAAMSREDLEMALAAELSLRGWWDLTEPADLEKGVQRKFATGWRSSDDTNKLTMFLLGQDDKGEVALVAESPRHQGEWRIPITDPTIVEWLWNCVLASPSGTPVVEAGEEK